MLDDYYRGWPYGSLMVMTVASDGCCKGGLLLWITVVVTTVAADDHCGDFCRGNDCVAVNDRCCGQLMVVDRRRK